MNQEQLDVLNITQETLRGLLTAIITASKPPLDVNALATSLQGFSTNDNISPMAQAMLLNLAELPQTLHSVNNPPH